MLQVLSIGMVCEIYINAGTVTSVDDANVCSVSQPTVPLADAASGEGSLSTIDA